MIDLKQFEPKTWQIADVVTNARGAKTAAISSSTGEPVIFILTTKDEPISAPFGAGVFDQKEGQTRLNLEFRTTPKIEEFLAQVDDAIVTVIESQCQRLLKKSWIETRYWIDIDHCC